MLPPDHLRPPPKFHGERDNLTTPEMLMRAVAAIESRLAVVLEVATHETKPLPSSGEP
jgi:hypothetical protein